MSRVSARKISMNPIISNVTRPLVIAVLSFSCVATASIGFAAQSSRAPLVTGSVSKAQPGSRLAQINRSSNASHQPSNSFKSGIRALQSNDINGALAARSKLKGGSLERKTLAWALAIKGRKLSSATLAAIAVDLSHWPGAKIIRNNIEAALVKENNPSALKLAFKASPPRTSEAALALAKAHLNSGSSKRARDVIAPFWSTQTLTRSEEAMILKHFGSILTRDDHRSRISYLFGKDRFNSAGRIAGLAGWKRLVAARTAVERNHKSAADKLANIPKSQRNDPAYLLAKARHLRKRDRVSQAANLLLLVKPNSIDANAADDHWREQRIVASDLLEVGKSKLAYQLAAHNTAISAAKRIDAEFYAGWLALTQRNSPKRAAAHFSALLDVATTPLSKSRGLYWLARAKEKSGHRADSQSAYSNAARFATTYYGQLASLKVGRKSLKISRTRASQSDRDRLSKLELLQAIDLLESVGEQRRARMMYRFLAKHLNSPGELALLAARAEGHGDHQLSLQIGKRAVLRGLATPSLAWPIGAIPSATKTRNTGLSLAYAVARQESTFQIDARSSANALGLMQLLPSTAKRTARSIGVKYSKRRLTTDPGYNATLGTAYLSQQKKRFGGSLVLAVAAYNAGPLRPEDWIKRFGDPRGKSLEFAINWVEQIPFSETRNYVQRVLENHQVYQSRLGSTKITLSRDLRSGKNS